MCERKSLIQLQINVCLWRERWMTMWCCTGRDCTKERRGECNDCNRKMRFHLKSIWSFREVCKHARARVESNNIVNEHRLVNLMENLKCAFFHFKQFYLSAPFFSVFLFRLPLSFCACASLWLWLGTFSQLSFQRRLAVFNVLNQKFNELCCEVNAFAFLNAMKLFHFHFHFLFPVVGRSSTNIKCKNDAISLFSLRCIHYFNSNCNRKASTIARFLCIENIFTVELSWIVLTLFVVVWCH